MREFKYTITDPMGMHARPAGQFVKEASRYQSSITLTKGGKSVDVKKIFAVMGLAVKCGEEVKISLDGADEDEAADGLRDFMEENL
ncbi:HPr family phosphocarrier protein [Blautia liquoris]|uniref:HPr family phosphocarrier protein n=1 Tax=Blautia liquoris TaxID=2779518 RepID=A0A7M2RIK8_9FIRM|nr:HPr family phosphocarrier protein [Blautia liquoris]QOV19192.1 HPr family phosphocarrier protein [Blautia liquoris]